MSLAVAATVAKGFVDPDTITPTIVFGAVGSFPFHAVRRLKAANHRLPTGAQTPPRPRKNPVSENCWRFAFRRYAI